jgi:hypothetical protein
VHRQRRANFVRQAGDAQVLHDQRIGAGARNAGNGVCRTANLRIENQSIESHEPLHAVRMQLVHHARQGFE